MLLPTRCVGVHLRGVVEADATGDPTALRCEGERESDEVRSRRRVWYPKGSIELWRDDVEDVEFDRSIQGRLEADRHIQIGGAMKDRDEKTLRGP